MNKEEKELIYSQQMDYINYIVYSFIKHNKLGYLQIDEDLKQEAAIEFISNIDKYDPSTAQLSTFIWNIVSNGLHRSLHRDMGIKAHLIEIPVDISEKFTFPEFIPAPGKMTADKVDLYRKEEQQITPKGRFASLEELEQEVPTNDFEYILKECKALTDAESNILRLYYQEGCTFEEIATSWTELDSSGKVWSRRDIWRLHEKAIKKLQRVKRLEQI